MNFTNNDNSTGHMSTELERITIIIIIIISEGIIPRRGVCCVTAIMLEMDSAKRTKLFAFHFAPFPSSQELVDDTVVWAF